MCHSEEDESLWLDDPQEYIRIKYGKFHNKLKNFCKFFSSCTSELLELEKIQDD